MRRLFYLLAVAAFLICGNESAFAQRRIAEVFGKAAYVLTKKYKDNDKTKNSKYSNASKVISEFKSVRILLPVTVPEAPPFPLNNIGNGLNSNSNLIKLTVPDIHLYETPRTAIFPIVDTDTRRTTLESSSLMIPIELSFKKLNKQYLTNEQRNAIVNELFTYLLTSHISGQEAEIKKYILEFLPYMKTREERVVFAKILLQVNVEPNAISFGELYQTKNKPLMSTDFSSNFNITPTETDITSNSISFNQASQSFYDDALFKEEMNKSYNEIYSCKLYSDLLFQDALDEFEYGNDSLGIMILNLSKSVAAQPRQSVKAAYLLSYIDGDTSKLDSIITSGVNCDIYRIAELYKTGTVVKKDREKYISILELAPSYESMAMLAQELESDEDRKLEMYEKFDARGYCDSTSLIFRADHYYDEGLSGKADSLYVRAYEKNFLSPDRIFRLASILEDSDVTMAVTLYGEAADKGYSDAANRIAEMYMNGDKVDIDYDKAYHYLTGFESVSPDLCCTLGRIYMGGKKVAKDYNKAQDLLSIAYDSGNMTAGKYLKKVNRKLK